MKRKPVKEYVEPDYSGFELKNGAKLAAGVAAAAMLAGALSGCSAVGKLNERNGSQPPEATVRADMTLGVIAYTDFETPKPTPTQPPEFIDGDIQSIDDFN